MGYSMALRAGMKYGKEVGKKMAKNKDCQLAIGVVKTMLKGGSPVKPLEKKAR